MSLLDKYKLSFEYSPDHPDILKAIRKAKRARKQRREAQIAKRDKSGISDTEQFHAKGTRRNNRDKSPAKKAKD